MLKTIQSAASLPLNRRLTISGRLDSSTCEFYGYVDDSAVYNEYTIEMAGWGNDGSSNGCAAGVPSIIQTQCRAKLDNFACTQVYENLHDTQISFRINKAAIAQPDCITEALRIASIAAHHEQTIECFCLAECWPSQTVV
ncbi:hypothetical protein RRF57_003591 [Xylaria bambusicola]|uniref:Uncharacterized protein n=1 Tax=Xylaria bambusicola TaxID=326684 RepID=A0AAN7Z7S1_9PEZI